MQIKRFNFIAVLFFVVLIFTVFEVKAQADTKANFCAELERENLAVASDEILLAGEVIAPQKLKVKNEITLSESIARAGGLTRKANFKQIQVIKCSADYKLKSIIVLDYDKIRKGMEKDLKLEGGNIIAIPNKSSIIVIPNKKETIRLINPHLISGEN